MSARPPTQPLRALIIHLTPWAPGCAELAMGDPKRRRRFDTREPAAILARLVSHLGVPPADLTIAADPDDEAEVQLIGPVPDPDRPRQILAAIIAGATADKARAWLATLIQSTPGASA